MGGLEGVDPTSPLLSGLRDSIRQVSARSRDGAMLCRVVDGRLVLEGAVLDRSSASDERWLQLLLERLIALEVGAVTVREGASPGELLTLARLLAQSHPPVGVMRTPSFGAAVIDGATIEPAHADSDAHANANAHAHAHDDESPRELMRTWSVLVTRVVPPRDLDGDDRAGAMGAGVVLSRLAAARSDEAASAVVDAVQDVLDDAQRRGDASLVDGIARAVLAQVQAVGESGGRVALEGALRLLMRAPLIELLARQFPLSPDRPLLVQLFARAGDAGVSTLVQQLLTTDDANARRAYFDGIVATDVGSVKLMDALRDSRWYVVRNAAALLGEMGVEHADETLIPLLHHVDERIRIAASRALIRLRTVKAIQALHLMIDDPNAEVRRLFAAAFGLAGTATGAVVRPPAAKISAALEREMDEDVALEMLAALGRLGSADAVQRLLRIALPIIPDMSGDVAATRDPWVRIAALEALVRARGAQMHPVIDILMTDLDDDVAAAAAALKDILPATTHR